MAFDRGKRGHRLEQYPRRGESERDRRDRGHDDRGFYGGRRVEDDETGYVQPSDRRHWRGHDYHGEEEFERGRDYGSYDRLRQRPLEAQHRERFLRRGENDERVRELSGREEWDNSWSGPYAGRGPKGYRRSDERIQEDVCERLTEHPSIDASEIEINVLDGDVTLSGQVESRAIKHLTETMVETVSGVKEVHNQLRVVPLKEGNWTRSSEENREAPAPEAVSRARRR